MKRMIRKILFFILLFVTMLPLTVIPLASSSFSDRNHINRAQDGVIDLKEVDLQDISRIPLQGEWLFYDHQWIVSEKNARFVEPCIINIPTSWNSEAKGVNFNRTYGYGSYQLDLKNLTSTKEFTGYIPGFEGAYRVYLNDTLVATNNEMSKNASQLHLGQNIIKNKAALQSGENVRLIIEVASRYYPIVNQTPILIEYNYDYAMSKINQTISSMYIGIFAVLGLIYLLIVIIRNQGVFSLSLWFMLLILTLKVFNFGEINSILGLLFPFINTEGYQVMIEVAAIVLPLTMFTYSARALHREQMQKSFRLLAILTGISILGRVFQNSEVFGPYQIIFRTMAFLPALIAIIFYWEALKNKTEYALVLWLGYTAVLFGIFMETMSFLGLYIYDVSMVIPTCLFIFYISLLYVYITKNREEQTLAQRAQQNELDVSKMMLRLKEAESSLMLSQIRPHFLNNALIAIYNLNLTSPEEANEVILKFAKYMRANMRSIVSKDPIPFEEELEHIKNYVSIEKLRFADRLQVIYEIEETEFKVPPLTIQPLIENAIKHGVCKKIEGGTVKISTKKMQDFIRLTIQDDGVGFDVEEVSKRGGDAIGIKNITDRLQLLMSATINIQSVIKEGTIITINIPSEGV